MITLAVLGRICIVGMGGAEHFAHILIVLGVLVGVAHNKSDRATCRFTFEHATEQLKLVSLLTACGYRALTWATTVKLRLDEVKVDVNASRHAVHHSTHGLAMTLAE